MEIIGDEIGMVQGLTDVVSTEIESLQAGVFARVNTGLEMHQARCVCAWGWGGGDYGEGQSERGEDGPETHFD